jgi:hypothetical protein
LRNALRQADELDLKPSLGGQVLGVGADRFAQRLGPARVVEQADAAPAKIARHRPCVADVRQRTGDHDPVETGQHGADLVSVLFDKGVHRSPPAGLHVYPHDSRSALFGSGFAGLGCLS